MSDTYGVDWLRSQRFLVIDTETTGPDPETARIVQLACVAVTHGELDDRWVTHINPGCAIPRESTTVHGITDDDVLNAPVFADIAGELLGRARGRYLCGYNAEHYDVPIIRRQLQEVGLEPTGLVACLDPLVWCREIDRFVTGSGRHRLAVACARHGIPHPNAHDALADAEAAWALMLSLAEARPHRFPPTIGAALAEQARLGAQQEREFHEWLARQPKREAVGT